MAVARWVAKDLVQAEELELRRQTFLFLLLLRLLVARRVLQLLRLREFDDQSLGCGLVAATLGI